MSRNRLCRQTAGLLSLSLVQHSLHLKPSKCYSTYRWQSPHSSKLCHSLHSCLYRLEKLINFHRAAWQLKLDWWCFDKCCSPLNRTLSWHSKSEKLERYHQRLPNSAARREPWYLLRDQRAHRRPIVDHWLVCREMCQQNWQLMCPYLRSYPNARSDSSLR